MYLRLLWPNWSSCKASFLVVFLPISRLLVGIPIWVRKFTSCYQNVMWWRSMQPELNYTPLHSCCAVINPCPSPIRLLSFYCWSLSISPFFQEYVDGCTTCLQWILYVMQYWVSPSPFSVAVYVKWRQDPATILGGGFALSSLVVTVWCWQVIGTVLVRSSSYP
jgi:hypothetical protein